MNLTACGESESKSKVQDKNSVRYSMINEIRQVIAQFHAEKLSQAEAENKIRDIVKNN